MLRERDHTIQRNCNQAKGGEELKSDGPGAPAHRQTWRL
jgi:hypothetical protein